MSTNISASTRKTAVDFRYHSVRSVSSPDDFAAKRKVYVGYTSVAEILQLPTDENVRGFLPDAEGKQRRRYTQVHRAIRETLENDPEDFSVLNSGIVVVARGCEVDEKNKVLRLKRPSIINGSQTQGVIRDYQAEIQNRPNGGSVIPANIQFELLVTDDEDLIAEVSIARNFQEDVMSVSIAGRRGQLDELEQSLQKKLPDTKLQKSETQLGESYIATERLLQLVAALVPESLWLGGKDFNKVYTYSMRAKCLKEFRDLYIAAKDDEHERHQVSVPLYQFYLDIAATAWKLYWKWKSHQGFQGTGLWCIERYGREIIDVPDGIIFPILSAFSAFAVKTRSGWDIVPPPLFGDEELIKTAVTLYKQVASHNPWVMGKSHACYLSLYQITSIYRRLSPPA
jgi:hypothetical protein